MKKWQEKALGFSAPWWLLCQGLIDGYEYSARITVGFAGLAIGALWAVFVAGVEGERAGKTVAAGFLWGVIAIVALPFLLMAVVAFVVLLSTLGGLLGL